MISICELSISSEIISGRNCSRHSSEITLLKHRESLRWRDASDFRANQSGFLDSDAVCRRRSRRATWRGNSNFLDLINQLAHVVVVVVGRPAPCLTESRKQAVLCLGSRDDSNRGKRCYAIRQIGNQVVNANISGQGTARIRKFLANFSSEKDNRLNKILRFLHTNIYFTGSKIFMNSSKF